MYYGTVHVNIDNLQPNNVQANRRHERHTYEYYLADVKIGKLEKNIKFFLSPGALFDRFGHSQII